MLTLVTGATGFLGRHLVRELRKSGHVVTALGSADADLTDPGSLTPFVQDYDQIYHLAAWTQAGDFCLRHPGEQWVINQAINTNVLDWWRRTVPRAKMIAIGTSCSYDPGLPLVEANYLAGTPIESLFTYAHTKRMMLVGLMALQRQFDLRYLYVVPSTIFGPGYHTDGRQMHFIFDLIRKILRGRDYGEPVVLWGDGTQRRELILATDFVQALVELSRVTDNAVVNVGAGEEHSIRDFAGMICRHVGFDPEAISYDTSRYVGARSKCLDVGRLEALLPNRQKTPLREALASTIDWMSRSEHFKEGNS